MNERRREKIEDGVREFLERGETVRSGVAGQTPIGITPFVLIPILLVILLAIVRNRLVVVTDRNVYVFAAKYLKPMSAQSAIEKHAIGSVDVAYSYPLMPVVRVGRTKVWAHWAHSGDAKAVVEDAEHAL